VGTRRLTRKEIVQEDKIHSFLARTYQWFGANSLYVLIAVVAVTAALAGMYLWRYYSETSSQKLQAQFADALNIHAAPAGSEEPATANAAAPKYRFATEEERHEKALAKFSEIMNESPRSQIGQFATYYVALNQHSLGKTAEAKQTMERVIEGAREPVVRNLARNYLAHISEVEKNHEQAVTLLNGILQDPTPAFPGQSVLLRLGSNYEALGKNDEALKQYERVVSDYPDTQESEQARAKIDDLQKVTTAAANE
jgi:predicted negative regulator of RcsB-dependent stress response